MKKIFAFLALLLAVIVFFVITNKSDAPVVEEKVDVSLQETPENEKNVDAPLQKVPETEENKEDSTNVLQSVLDDKEGLSPFVGMWDWEGCIDSVQWFDISISERNDSLLFVIGGIWEYGNKFDYYLDYPNYDPVAKVRVKKKNSRIVRSKIHIKSSSFYHVLLKDENKYNDVLFALLDDTLMLFVLNDDALYWPDTAFMIRRDRKNRTVSQEEDEYLYKGEVE